MNRLFITISTICYLSFCTLGLQAQKQYENWFFGQGVGFNFSSGSPVIVNNTNLNCLEGSATMSDNNGNLLFYTNGVRVFNRTKDLMLNGANLLGDVSSTCNSVAVLLPGSDSIYYLFTVGAANKPNQAFRYSIINMRRDNGLGEVTIKNTLIEDEVYEKLAAVRHCNNRDIWITIRKWETDEYHSYLLSPTGLSQSPVVSHTGLVVGGYFNNALGSLKFSPDRKRLAAAHSFENDEIELMDFNNSTGQISNSIFFKPHQIQFFTGCYGVEFSPDSKLMYVSANLSDEIPAILYQFDILQTTASAILNSKVIIGTNTLLTAGGLQIGLDKKIYYSLYKDSAVSVILNPDIPGTACNYQQSYIDLGGGRANPKVQYGFPTMIASDLDTLTAPPDFYSNTDCATLNTIFHLNNETGIDSVFWEFGDGSYSRLLSPAHIYAAYGTYPVKLQVYKNNSCLPEPSTIFHELQITNSAIPFLPGDTTACAPATISLSPNVSGANYLWSTGATSPGINVSTSGIYWLDMNYKGCTIRDSVIVTLKAVNSLNLGKDTTICTVEPVKLTADNISGATYLWNNGENTASIFVNKPGIYSVAQSFSNCIVRDTIVIKPGDCPLFIPNAFTPDGDGRNDNFGVSGVFFSTYFDFTIFNRYGQPVFRSSDPALKWDGTMKGKKQPLGGYTWQLTYKNKQGFFKTSRGTVMLIR
ncbi:MAG: gliding motility-associated C-terminal domain-containing protein [Ferruginibacter sp.]